MLMNTPEAPAERWWSVTRAVILNASSVSVWQVIGGFYNIHTWHPDIAKTAVPEDQTTITPLRRVLTFPGQPETTEELILLDHEQKRCKYKWFAGAWGEQVKHYSAELRILALDNDEQCVVQWSSTFLHTEDAITEFYQRGFTRLREIFKS